MTNVQTGKTTLNLIQEFEKFGVIRDALKSLTWLSKLKPLDTRADSSVIAPAQSFHETKALEVALEAKRAEALSHARRVSNIPR